MEVRYHACVTIKLMQFSKHVLSDLSCYVCLFEDCPAADRLFDTLTDLWSHMEWQHCLRYSCRMAEHPTLSFNTATELCNHIESQHLETLHSSNINTLVKSSAYPVVDPLAACPMCFDDLNRDEIISGGTHLVDNSTKHNNRMRNHVAYHLEAIALLSLPPRDDGDVLSAMSEVQASDDTDDPNDLEEVDEKRATRFGSGRYSVGDLLKLRESPLVSKPPNLPAIEDISSKQISMKVGDEGQSSNITMQDLPHRTHGDTQTSHPDSSIPDTHGPRAMNYMSQRKRALRVTLLPRFARRSTNVGLTIEEIQAPLDDSSKLTVSESLYGDPRLSKKRRSQLALMLAHLTTILPQVPELGDEIWLDRLYIPPDQAGLPWDRGTWQLPELHIYPLANTPIFRRLSPGLVPSRQIFSLAIALIEICFETPIDFLMTEDEARTIGTNEPRPFVLAVIRLSEEVNMHLGEWYASVVKCCLHFNWKEGPGKKMDFEDADVRHEFQDKIIDPLELFYSAVGPESIQ